MTGKELKEKLDKKGSKQQWLADCLGVNKTLVSRWVSGTVNIPKKHLVKIKSLLK